MRRGRSRVGCRIGPRLDLSVVRPDVRRARALLFEMRAANPLPFKRDSLSARQELWLQKRIAVALVLLLILIVFALFSRAEGGHFRVTSLRPARPRAKSLHHRHNPGGLCYLIFQRTIYRGAPLASFYLVAWRDHPLFTAPQRNGTRSCTAGQPTLAGPLGSCLELPLLAESVLRWQST
jgi:hypothetical protein